MLKQLFILLWVNSIDIYLAAKYPLLLLNIYILIYANIVSFQAMYGVASLSQPKYVNSVNINQLPERNFDLLYYINFCQKFNSPTIYFYSNFLEIFSPNLGVIHPVPYQGGVHWGTYSGCKILSDDIFRNTALFWSLFLDFKIFFKAQQNVKLVPRRLIINLRLSSSQGSEAPVSSFNYILSN